MKWSSYKQLTVGMLSLLLFFSACQEKQNEPKQPQTNLTEVSLSVGGKTAEEALTIGAEGKSFFIKVHSTQPWRLAFSPKEASTWVEIKGKSEGFSANQLGIELKVKPNSSKERQARLNLYVMGEERGSISIIQQAGQGTDTNTPPTGGSDNGDEGTNPSNPDNGGGSTPNNPGNGGGSNPNNPDTGAGGTQPIIPPGEHIHGTTTLLEVPRLQGGSNMYFVTFRTSDNKPNYSVEYDVNKRHARWVAYSWDRDTARDVTGRNDAWGWDPIIPEKYSTDNWFSGSGFSRGHLVASNDRQYSVEANRQTFYYCNMSPQRQSHNAGVWLQLEALLQSWARGSLKYDALYVAKGGTIADDQIEDRRVKGIMVVPKYYWMAVLMKKGNTYHSIGFWTEHRKPNKVSDIRSISRTVDEIEQLTGIDLFHNLEDTIEKSVEAEAVDTFRWPGV